MYQSKYGNHDRIVRYDTKGDVHHIQARKAWEDTDTWMPAVVVTQSDRVLDVLFLAESETADDFSAGRPVWVTERWGVLAFADDDGNAIAIMDPDAMPDSVFAMAGTDRLRFLPIKRIETMREDLDELVYGTVWHPSGERCFFINRRVDAEYAAEVMEVIRSCSTWGEVRQVASLELYQDLLDRCGYGTLDAYLQHLDIGRPIPGAREVGTEAFDALDRSDLPGDDEPFSENQISGYIDGDFPPTPAFLQEQLLPADLADRYGKKIETIFNGTFLDLPPDSEQPIVAAMRALGYRCVEEPGLFTAAFRF